MSVWLTIPSARPSMEAQAVLNVWRERGYKLAIWRDAFKEPVDCDILIHRDGYPGYAKAVNALCAAVLETDPACEWCVAGGDDTFPDPNHTADQIAYQCGRYFGADQQKYREEPTNELTVNIGSGTVSSESYKGRFEWSTFGVMQPTGDRYASGSIDRIAGSPWMGREWCRRANAGAGPFYPEFTHMHGDEALLRTAEKLGVYWPRPDLIHLHKHFMRKSDAIDSPAVQKPIPPHLVRWNSQEHWKESQTLFRQLELQDFAPCMPVG